MNAITHGIRTKSVNVLPNEDPEAYRSHIEAWIHHYNPATPVEEQFVRRAANISWKLDRADRYENICLSRKMLDATDALTDVTQEETDETADLNSFDASSEGERLRRYQFSLHRELHRAVKSLTKNPPQTPETAQEKATLPVRESENGANKPNPQNGANKPNSVTPPPSAGTLSASQMISTASPKPVAPNKANFHRYFQGHGDAWGPKSLDLLQDRSPLDTGLTPPHKISCESR
ncbi:MAG: hypothetical protein ABS79_02575 [Planctomycetes bacterium SCN 63-9]|nr:MAG: hypothetical protein ABS79_02575 [Planctomycetes bacterium SCN 63-9]